MKAISLAGVAAAAAALAACGSSGEACQTLTPEAFRAEIGARDPGSVISSNNVVMRAYMEGGANVTQTGSDRVAYRMTDDGALHVEHQGSSVYFRLLPGETRLRVRNDALECSHHQ